MDFQPCSGGFPVIRIWTVSACEHSHDQGSLRIFDSLINIKLENIFDIKERNAFFDYLFGIYMPDNDCRVFFSEVIRVGVVSSGERLYLSLYQRSYYSRILLNFSIKERRDPLLVNERTNICHVNHAAR